MKSLYLLSVSLILAVSATHAAQAEKDVWYNAAGKVFKVTLAEGERVAYVPGWKQRENARLEAQRNGAYASRLRSSRGSRYSDYYGSYYSGPFYYGSGRGFNRFSRTSIRSSGRSSFGSRGGLRASYGSSSFFLRVR